MLSLNLDMKETFAETSQQIISISGEYIAVCADVHANHKRFRKFAAEVKGLDPKGVFVAGDLIDYGREKGDKKVLDLVRRKGFTYVSGNHETDVFPSFKHERIKSLDCDKYVDFIQQLPFEVKFNGILFSHFLPLRDRTRIFNLEQAAKALDHVVKRGFNLAFYGHSHVRSCFSYDLETGQYDDFDEDEFCLNASKVYIFNPGSLGKSAEGSYVRFSLDSRCVERRFI